MAPWAARGLREGVVTTPYPKRPDGYGPAWRGSVTVARAVPESADVDGEALCPTGAIATESGAVRLDRGRCILCGRCVEARPDLFRFDPRIEVASRRRHALVVPGRDEDEEDLRGLRSELAGRVRQFRRSVHVRHVDAGSDGAEEWEVAALTNPVYDVQRLGVFFTATPRHADILLATGAGARGMRGPLLRTHEAMPEPRIVLAVGADAASGGLVHPGYATLGGVGDILPVDVWVPGSPPSPFSILHGILLAVGLLAEVAR